MAYQYITNKLPQYQPLQVIAERKKVLHANGFRSLRVR